MVNGIVQMQRVKSMPSKTPRALAGRLIRSTCVIYVEGEIVMDDYQESEFDYGPRPGDYEWIGDDEAGVPVWVLVEEQVVELWI